MYKWKKHTKFQNLHLGNLNSRNLDNSPTPSSKSLRLRPTQQGIWQWVKLMDNTLWILKTYLGIFDHRSFLWWLQFALTIKVPQSLSFTQLMDSVTKPTGCKCLEHIWKKTLNIYMEPQRGIFLFLTISNPMFTSIRASTPGQQTNVHTQNRKLARAAMAVSRKTSGSGKC